MCEGLVLNVLKQTIDIDRSWQWSLRYKRRGYYSSRSSDGLFLDQFCKAEESNRPQKYIGYEIHGNRLPKGERNRGDPIF